MKNAKLANLSAGPKPGFDTLQTRVKRMAHPSGLLAAGACKLAGDQPRDLLTALLVELEETILPRRFRLHSTSGACICLDVADRRLMGVEYGDRHTGLQQMEPLSPETVLSLLDSFFDNATGATLQKTRLSRDKLATVSGIAISAVAAAGSLAMGAATDPDPIPSLLRDLTGVLSVWVKLDAGGSVIGKGGDLTRVSRLETLAKNGLADLESQVAQILSDPNQPGSILLNSGSADGLALLYARSRQSGILALLPARDTPKTQIAWRAFYA